MSKCGKGCMPECEYFTTGGCISPFNCAYKIEEHNQNTVFTNGDTNDLSGIEKFFVNTVKSGVLPQEPMNYDGAAMKAYISYLEFENAALRERLDKAVELPFKNLDKVFIVAGEDANAEQFIPDRIVEGTIVGFGYDIYEWGDGNYKFNYHVLVGENNYIFALEQFNKTLFKTREAAEARLAELKGENE